ncbi:MAG: glucosaminidase domain-containing protein [Kangiellaceae bacterium]
MTLSPQIKLAIFGIISLFLLSGCGDKTSEETKEPAKEVKQQEVTLKSNEPAKQDTIASKNREPISDKKMPPEAPDFTAFTDVKAKKQAFFDYMYYFIQKVNLEVLERRVTIDAILEKSADQLTKQDIAFVDEMSELYLKDHDSSDTLASAKILQEYIRVIPPSLALAQAANESAWGTSRFATDANNFFGQWCFKKGCGLIPSQRNSGQVHEVRKFESPEGSVRSYIRNLNTHYTYDELREIRDNLYDKNKPVTGIDLAEGLKGYSERGEEYVKELQSMIRFNKLTKFDTEFWESVEEE